MKLDHNYLIEKIVIDIHQPIVLHKKHKSTRYLVQVFESNLDCEKNYKDIDSLLRASKDTFIIDFSAIGIEMNFWQFKFSKLL